MTRPISVLLRRGQAWTVLCGGLERHLAASQHNPPCPRAVRHSPYIRVRGENLSELSASLSCPSISARPQPWPQSPAHRSHWPRGRNRSVTFFMIITGLSVRVSHSCFWCAAQCGTNIRILKYIKIYLDEYIHLSKYSLIFLKANKFRYSLVIYLY